MISHRYTKIMPTDRICYFVGALGVTTVLLIVAGPTTVLAGRLDLWQLDRPISRVIREVRDESSEAISTGKKKPPVRPSGTNIEFGDLDPDQDYFSYEEEETTTKTPPKPYTTIPHGPPDSDSNIVTIIVLCTLAALIAVIGIAAFVARDRLLSWYSNIRGGYDPGRVEADADKL